MATQESFDPLAVAGICIKWPIPPAVDTDQASMPNLEAKGLN